MINAIAVVQKVAVTSGMTPKDALANRGAHRVPNKNSSDRNLGEELDRRDDQRNHDPHGDDDRQPRRESQHDLCDSFTRSPRRRRQRRWPLSRLPSRANGPIPASARDPDCGWVAVRLSMHLQLAIEPSSSCAVFFCSGVSPTNSASSATFASFST